MRRYRANDSSIGKSCSKRGWVCDCVTYLLSGVPYVGPSNVCLHIFVVELYSFSLNCEENKMKNHDHGNDN